jgi:hypothetical protein
MVTRLYGPITVQVVPDSPVGSRQGRGAKRSTGPAISGTT